MIHSHLFKNGTMKHVGDSLKMRAVDIVVTYDMGKHPFTSYFDVHQGTRFWPIPKWDHETCRRLVEDESGLVLVVTYDELPLGISRPCHELGVGRWLFTKQHGYFEGLCEFAAGCRVIYIYIYYIRYIYAGLCLWQYLICYIQGGLTFANEIVLNKDNWYLRGEGLERIVHIRCLVINRLILQKWDYNNHFVGISLGCS